jgi:hypothetical protein
MMAFCMPCIYSTLSPISTNSMLKTNDALTISQSQPRPSPRSPTSIVSLKLFPLILLLILIDLELHTPVVEHSNLERIMSKTIFNMPQVARLLLIP